MNNVILSDVLESRAKIGANGTRLVALVSVTEKKEIVEFCKELNNITPTDFLSTGGTARKIREDAPELRVFDVAELVGGKELFGDLVKTLSREVAAGLLAPDKGIDTLATMGLPRIDLVCVDFYHLREAIEKEGSTREYVISKTDVGGPTMTHEAAKGGRIIVCRPEDRQIVLDWMKAGKPDEAEFIQALRARAEFEVAKYIGVSAVYHGDDRYSVTCSEKVLDLCYGENKNQKPAVLRSYRTDDPLAIPNFRFIAGSAPSWNTICAIDRGLLVITRMAAAWEVNFSQTTNFAIAMKHGTPCGASAGDDRVEVMKKTINGDRLAIMGGAVITNFPIDEELAELLYSYNLMEYEDHRLLDAVIAPSITEGAVDILKRKKCRHVTNQALADIGLASLDQSPQRRPVRGGELEQPANLFVPNMTAPNIAKYVGIHHWSVPDMLIGWAVGSSSYSNTIAIVQNRMLLANAAGQQDRVRCSKMAVWKAKLAGHGDLLEGATVYSDSFFPFKDGTTALHKAGLGTVFATSGSRNDAEVIKYCKRVGLNLIHVPDDDGRGFFGH